MKRPPKYKGGGGVPKIDRSKFQEHLSRPLNYGNNVVTPDTLGLAPNAIKPLGFDYYSGSVKGKDIVYKKGDNYFIYNEDPNGGQYGLVDVGNPFTPAPQAAPSALATKKPSVIDPMKVPGFNGILAPEKLKKGGSVKGYKFGGRISQEEYDALTPEQQSAYDQELSQYLGKLNTNAGVLAGVGAQAAELGATAIDANNQADDQGHVNINKAGLSGGLRGAGKGAAMGATVGSVIPGVGTAIGAGAGAVIGGVTGLLKSRKNAKDANALADDETEAEQLAAQKALAGRNIANAKMARDFNMFANGGEVKGKGTGTSDSIKAKVQPGSFVIPAKISSALKETIVRKAPKRAKLNQAGGTDVKLSDGEILLSPEDKEKLTNAGLNVNALAPNSTQGTNFSEGGTVEEKAALYDAIYGQSQDPPAKKAEFYDQVFGALPEKYRPKIQNGKIKVTEIGKEAAAKLFDEDGARKYNEFVSAAKAPENKQKFIVDPSSVPSAKEIYAAKRSAPKRPVQSSQTAQVQPEYLERKPIPSGTSQPDINPGITEIPSQQTQTPSYTNAPTNANNTKPDYLGVGSQIMNYGLPALQLGLGNKMLREAGKRPVDRIDPEYLNAIETAKQSVARAKEEAKFGYTPEEQFTINQNNTGAYTDARFGAKNFSGGSSANAFAMDRQAVNDYFSRAVDAKIKDRQLRMQKEGIVDQKQSYVDGLVSHKAAMERNLFADKFNAWNQNQQAGSNLLGAGVSNLMAANRFSQELAYNKDRDQKYGTTNYQGI